jgi:hypothetical protein
VDQGNRHIGKHRLTVTAGDTEFTVSIIMTHCDVPLSWLGPFDLANGAHAGTDGQKP